MRSCFGVQKQAIIRRFFFFASFSYPAHRVNETNLRTLRRVKHRHFCVLYQFSPYGDYFFSWVRIANYIQLCPSIYRHIVSSMNLKKKPIRLSGQSGTRAGNRQKTRNPIRTNSSQQAPYQVFRLILIGERFFFSYSPKFRNNWRYVSTCGGALSLFVKLSSSKKIKFIKFHIFGKKNQENMEVEKLRAEKSRKFGGKKTLR